MKGPGENCSDVTNLKPCDHQAFFEVLALPNVYAVHLPASRRDQALVLQTGA